MQAVVAAALASPGVSNESAPRVVRVALLQRMSDARLKSPELCNGAAGKWEGGTCWLGEGWQATAAAGLAAANDFNARIGSYVPQFASEAMRACNVQLNVSVIDSGSTGMRALEQLTTQLLDDEIAPDVRRPLTRCLPACCLTQLSNRRNTGGRRASPEHSQRVGCPAARGARHAADLLRLLLADPERQGPVSEVFSHLPVGRVRGHFDLSAAGRSALLGASWRFLLGAPLRTAPTPQLLPYRSPTAPLPLPAPHPNPRPHPPPHPTHTPPLTPPHPYPTPTPPINSHAPFCATYFLA